MARDRNPKRVPGRIPVGVLAPSQERLQETGPRLPSSGTAATTTQRNNRNPSSRQVATDQREDMHGHNQGSSPCHSCNRSADDDNEEGWDNGEGCDDAEGERKDVIELSEIDEAFGKIESSNPGLLESLDIRPTMIVGEEEDGDSEEANPWKDDPPEALAETLHEIFYMGSSWAATQRVRPKVVYSTTKFSLPKYGK